MNENQRRARAALFSLKEAVLDVLLEAHTQNEGLLQPEDIRKRLGIPKADEPITRSNTVILGILFHLRNDKYVHHYINRGWEITEHAVPLLETVREENQKHSKTPLPR